MIEEFEFDDNNVEEMARHGVTQEEVVEVLERGEYRLWKNKSPHAEKRPFMVQGRTFSGRVLHIPGQPTAMPGVWRPATAYDPSPSQYRR